MASNDNFLDDSLSGEIEKNIKERDKKMSELFRCVFSTPEGRQVLWQILEDLHFFKECVTEHDVALNNYAKFMIKKRLRVDNTKQITNLIMDLGD